MRVVWLLIGTLLLLAGLGGLVVVLGDVFSQPQAALALNGQIWAMVAFHAVATGLGTLCIGKALGQGKVVAV